MLFPAYLDTHNSNYFRAISEPRKWKPPRLVSMTDGETKTMDTAIVLTPGRRIGLCRNYKSPKPLHSHVKWTP